MELWLIQLIVGAVLSVAGTLLQQMSKPKAKASGFQGTAQVGGDNPLAFILGWYATAGKLEYAGAWGSAGDTPNAYLSKVFTLSDLPVRGLAGLQINGAPCTLGDVPHASRGYPVLEFRKGGKDYLWVLFHDGSQTTADSLLLTAFGSHPDRPWQADMIGRGVAYGITTALFNREVFNREPEVVWELDGVALDDPRGDDEHENPAVATDNVLRGFSYGGAWLWGPQGIASHHLPAAVWEPQMDKCDVAIDLDGGATEKRYRFGLEVHVDQEPHEVIDELLKACSGRIAEIGGIYKILVGEPDAAVVSFTDEDVIITAGQSFEPFPGLEGTYNAITATYPEPAEGWEPKEAPPRYSSTWESQDDGRRLPFTTTFDAVPFANQVQRLMRPAIEEARRFRRHSQTMPPEWWEYEVLDVAQWISARNGYADKAFLITVMEDQPNANQVIGLQEIEPADYGWDSDYELPYDIAPLTIARPAPQPMTGWAVAPGYIPDNDGAPRKPSIEVSFAAGLVDVRAVRVQVRLAGATAPVFDGELPYDTVDTEPAALLPGVFISDTTYEVRGKYLPHTGRGTLWSNQDEDGTEAPWFVVTTPNLPDVELPPIAPEMLGPELAAAHGFLVNDEAGALSALVESFRQDMDNLAGAVSTANMTANVIRQLVEARFGSAAAAVFTEQQARATQYSALATQITQVLAQVDEVIADGYLRFESVVDGGGALATITAKVKASAGADFSQAAWILRAEADGLGGTDAYFGVLGTFYVFATPEGDPIPAFAVDGTTGRVRFNDWDSIAAVGGVPIIQMHGSTGDFSITVP